ncbi:MAG: CsoS2 family carboxysome shell protein [Halothiobacillaceae bacterium]
MSVTNNKPTGREAAMARRQLQVHGRAGRSSGSASAAPAAAKPAASGRAAAMQARQRQVVGKRAAPVQASAPAPQPAARTERQEAPAQQPAASEKPVFTPRGNGRNGKSTRRVTPNKPVVANEGRLQSRAYRNAQIRGKATVDAVRSQSGSPASLARVANPKASSREIARQVRAERCTRGKVCTTGGRRNTGGRGAPAPKTDPESVPAKVNYAQTERGQQVSGPKMGPGEQMTGAEYGACRSVTGTQYLGPDLFSSLCGSAPEPGPAKVSVSASRRGQSVSGTLVGRSQRTTGDEVGFCRSVTGTDYLPADQSDLYCSANGGAAQPAQRRPMRSSVMFDRPERAPEPAAPVAEGPVVTGGRQVRRDAPVKSYESSTAAGSRISGTSVDRVLPVTGDEPGRCKGVTGTPYLSRETVTDQCSVTPDPGASKVRDAATFGGQRVTGARVGNGERLTGAEAGRCEPVSGTPYLGPDQFQTCSTEDVHEAVQRTTPRRRGSSVARPISGQQPGVDHLTGAQRGVCNPVSGTPYFGHDQVQGYCGGHFEAEPGDPDFPVMISGDAAPVAPTAPPVSQPSDAQSRFTGDFARAAGKVTGVDEGWARPSGQPQAAPVSPMAAAQRFTGEASQAGSRITGDAWDRGDRVTGTEGPWAQQRNVSFKGGGAGAFAGARLMREQMEREHPESPISGSSGNTRTGALVTVSGGARG